jgi:hypothetical protein
MKRSMKNEKLKVREIDTRELSRVRGGEMVPAANQLKNISWGGGVGDPLLQ